MKTRHWLLLCSISLFGCLIASWGTIRGVAWVRDLPNRIIIDPQPLADGFGKAVVQSYHDGLRGEQAAVQIQILQDFISLSPSSSDAKHWVQAEYYDDIRQLTFSPDDKVAALANELLLLLL